MQYVVRFVSAESGAGKTTIASRIVEILRRRGVVVGVVKHCAGGVVLEEKDSKKYLESGAVVVAASSPGLVVVYEPGFPDSLENALAYVKTPFVVVEGYRESSTGDAVVVADSVEKALELAKTVSNLVAVYTWRDQGTTLNTVRVFKPGEEEVLAGFLEERAVESLLGVTGGLNCGACGYPTCRDLVKAYIRGQARWCPAYSDIRVVVNGVETRLNPFVKSVVRSVVLGLIEPLKGVPRDRRRVIVEVST